MAPAKNAARGSHVCDLDKKSISPEVFPKIPKETAQNKKTVNSTDNTITIPPMRGVFESLIVLFTTEYSFPSASSPINKDFFS
jgi:hypothetical protein